MEPARKLFVLRGREWAPILLGIVLSSIGFPLAQRSAPLADAWRWASTVAGVAGVVAIVVGFGFWLCRVNEWIRESKK